MVLELSHHRKVYSFLTLKRFMSFIAQANLDISTYCELAKGEKKEAFPLNLKARYNF
jgi:hypothetical protein